MKNLPEEYLNSMKKLLGSEYGEFLRCYEEEHQKGLRFNTKKARPDTIEKLIAAWNLEKIPWTPFGYYYSGEFRPGLSPYHDSGVFYIQEPSAMAVCEMAGIKETDTVLDLCAAPGGKSTRAAELCNVLLSNEIIPKRAKILSSNIERMGFGNVLVSSCAPAELAEIFPGYFDVVICDAPCSGEGMMRRDEIAVSEWSMENAEQCVFRQREILVSACEMVKPGGKLVYSTCTFEKAEDEDQMVWLSSRFGDLTMIQEHRFWPHKEKGEGHYLCVMRKGEDGKEEDEVNQPEKVLRQMKRRLFSGKQHILRAGLPEGEIIVDKKKQKIYVPSHAEVMASVFPDCENGVNLRNEETALRYLRGEELRLSAEEALVKGKEGYVSVYYDGYPLGLGKRIGMTVKNHLPKGLRRVK